MPPCRFSFKGKISDKVAKALSEKDIELLLLERLPYGAHPRVEVTQWYGSISFYGPEPPCKKGGRLYIEVDLYNKRWRAEFPPDSECNCQENLPPDFCEFKERVRRTVQRILTLIRNISEAGDATPAPKGTDVALPATVMESNHVHGGVHSSGEVPDSRQASPEGRQEAQSRASGTGSHCPQKATCESDQKTTPDVSGRGSRAMSEHPESARTEANGMNKNASSEARTSEEEATREDAPEKEWKDTPEGTREQSTVPVPGDPREAGSEKIGLKTFRGFGRLSRMPRKAFGSQLARLSQPERALVRQMEKIMSRVRLDNELDVGPRTNLKKVACKVAGYLRPVTLQDNKIEEGRPALLVLPDVSGSMGRFTNMVTKVGMALGATGKHGWDVLVVSHSNGFPCEVSINGKPAEQAPKLYSEDEALEWYKGLIERYNLRLVIACADWDGAWLYKHLVNIEDVVKLIWLDPYCCSQAEPKIVDLPENSGFDKHEKTKVVYSIACGSVEQVLSALSQAMKRI